MKAHATADFEVERPSDARAERVADARARRGRLLSGRPTPLLTPIPGHVTGLGAERKSFVKAHATTDFEAERPSDARAVRHSQQPAEWAAKQAGILASLRFGPAV